MFVVRYNFKKLKYRKRGKIFDLILFKFFICSESNLKYLYNVIQPKIIQEPIIRAMIIIKTKIFSNEIKMLRL